MQSSLASWQSAAQAPAVVHFFRGLFGNPFRSFVHSPTAMDGLLTDLGFKLQSRVRTFAWEIAMYAR